jgi:hypothetical protein
VPRYRNFIVIVVPATAGTHAETSRLGSIGETFYHQTTGVMGPGVRRDDEKGRRAFMRFL